MAVAGMVIVGVVCYALGEIMVRLFEPGASRYPNQHFSLDYGPVDYPNRRIVHTVPGQWRFEYTTNRFGHRGEEPEVASSYPVPNVLLLGDSYTFGIGLNDEDELGAVPAEKEDETYFPQPVVEAPDPAPAPAPAE